MLFKFSFIFSIVLGTKKGMKRQTKRSSKVMVRRRLPVPEIRFLMCQISRALRSLKRVMLCVNAAMIPMAKKVCKPYLLKWNILNTTFILNLAYYVFLVCPFYIIVYNKKLHSSVRQTWVEDVLLYITRARAIPAQGWTRFPQRQFAQCYTYSSRVGYQGDRLHKKTACFPIADCRPGWVSLSDKVGSTFNLTF